MVTLPSAQELVLLQQALYLVIAIVLGGLGPRSPFIGLVWCTLWFTVPSICVHLVSLLCDRAHRTSSAGRHSSSLLLSSRKDCVSVQRSSEWLTWPSVEALLGELVVIRQGAV